jgi:L-lactate dehydrogenase complex protein LldF
MSRPAGFAAGAARACADAQLQANLKAAALHFQGNQAKAFAAFPGGQAARDLARDVKDAALADLPDLLRQLEEQVTALGGTVHWAADAAEACAILTDIASEAEVSTAVKGKSMVTEEIGLNPALEDAGLEVYETDLAEYIIQLAGEPPSHIMAPAIHKNAARWASSSTSGWGPNTPRTPPNSPRSPAPPCAAASCARTGRHRREPGAGRLRDPGSPGERGNIRMSTTAPRVHAAVVGIEKVLPGPEAAAAVLAVLARSAIGMKMASYTSFLAGARRDGERDGAQAFHLVLLDNGRSRILADPELRQVLRCLRCGACLNFCPVYEKAGGHAWNNAYCGPIGTCLAPLWDGGRPGPAVCLHRVRGLRRGLPGAHRPARSDRGPAPPGGRGPGFRGPALPGGPPLSAAAARMYARVAGSPALFRGTAALARTLDPGLALASRLVPGLRAWTRTRKPPRLRTPFRKAWPALARQLGGKGGAA